VNTSVVGWGGGATFEETTGYFRCEKREGIKSLSKSRACQCCDLPFTKELEKGKFVLEESKMRGYAFASLNIGSKTGIRRRAEVKGEKGLVSFLQKRFQTGKKARMLNAAGEYFIQPNSLGSQKNMSREG